MKPLTASPQYEKNVMSFFINVTRPKPKTRQSLAFANKTKRKSFSLFYSASLCAHAIEYRGLLIKFSVTNLLPNFAADAVQNPPAVPVPTFHCSSPKKRCLSNSQQKPYKYWFSTKN